MATAAEEVKTEIPVTRSSAIADAIKSAEADIKVEAGDKVNEPPIEKEKKEPAKVSEQKVNGEVKEDDEKVLAAQGLELIKALKDPSKAPLVVKFLAEQAGYTKTEPTTKTEVKEIKNDILEELKAGLGEEFSVIADRLAPAIEKILAKKLEESQKDIRQKFEEQEADKLRNQSAAAIEKLSSDFFGTGEELPADVQKEMSSFMDRVAPSKDSSIKEYVGDAFHYAIGKLGLQKLDPVVKERKERARSDASSRLASARVPAADSLKPDNSKPMTRQEAIQKAIEAVNKEQ